MDDSINRNDWLNKDELKDADLEDLAVIIWSRVHVIYNSGRLEDNEDSELFKILMNQYRKKFEAELKECDRSSVDDKTRRDGFIDDIVKKHYIGIVDDYRKYFSQERRNNKLYGANIMYQLVIYDEWIYSLRIEMEDLIERYRGRRINEIIVFDKTKHRHGESVLTDNMELYEPLTPPKPDEDDEIEDDGPRKYSQKVVKIAYWAIRERITTHNYNWIAKEYTTSTTDKIKQKPYSKSSDLTEVSGNKSADTKHMNCLAEAMGLLENMKCFGHEQLVDGSKRKKAIEDLSLVIDTFEEKYEREY
jgi:hypothetical protein